MKDTLWDLEDNSMKNIIRLRGKHINLCVFRTDDSAIAKYVKWMNDENILMWIGRNNKIVQWTAEREWALRPITDDTHRFNIVTKKNALIGNCDIKVINSNAILGICIGEESGRDKGYGTEVIKMLIKFAFEELNVHRVKLTLNGDNNRAHRCYKKAGLVDCGIEHETQWYHNHWCDTIHMEILREHYERLACSDDIVIQLDNNNYLRLWFSDNEAITEGCDACIGYALYDKDKLLLDGGEYDYDSAADDYETITDAINDIIEFATEAKHDYVVTDLTFEDFDE